MQIASNPNARVALVAGRSDPLTWVTMGQFPPQDGSDMVISSGFNVLLDMSTPVLDSLVIEDGGALIFDDTKPSLILKVVHTGGNIPPFPCPRTDRCACRLLSPRQASIVHVLGGLYIGDINTPYRNNATIRLFGDPTSPSLFYNGLDFGSKVRL